MLHTFHDKFPRFQVPSNRFTTIWKENQGEGDGCFALLHVSRSERLVVVSSSSRTHESHEIMLDESKLQYIAGPNSVERESQIPKLKARYYDGFCETVLAFDLPILTSGTRRLFEVSQSVVPRIDVSHATLRLESTVKQHRTC